MSPSRNSPCPCNSGKKYKQCCGRIENTPATATHEPPQSNVPAEQLMQLAELMNTGRFAQLEARSRQMTQTYPNEGVVWQLLAVSLSAQAKDALAALQIAAELLPNDAVAQLNLGNALGRSGRTNEAITYYRRALQINPSFAEAHSNLGNALLQAKSYQEAIASFREAIQLKPEFSQAHNALGNVLRELGQFENAIECYQRAVNLQSNFAEAHGNLGAALSAIGKVNEAIASYRRAIQLAPNLIEVHVNLGNVLREITLLDEAIASYQRALSINPNFVGAHLGIATALRLQGQTSLADARCQQVLDRLPQSAVAMQVLAEIRADQGKFSEAGALFRQVLQLDPLCTEAWNSFARIHKFTEQDDTLMQRAQQITTQSLLPRQELYVRYALGKYFDDIKEFDAAFSHYHRANELTKMLRLPHIQQQVTDSTNLMIKAFNKDAFTRLHEGGSDQDRPVFIVGMLRSGTSLAEQILASHPQVFGAGELLFWSGIASKMDFSQISAPSTIAKIKTAATQYLESLRKLSADAVRVIDKMPTNFLFMGLIHAALPNARFIHMQRNPADTCLSIYFQHFETSLTYANDLHDLAHYYREYLRLMQHWREIIPPHSLLEVPYESLVEQPELWSRKMVGFIGLPWDERCLNFDLANRTVLTASKWQVRQKINNKSVDRWRNYEKFIGPLRELLR